MDVTIYYTEGYENAPSGIERITTPLESGFDRWRARFGELEAGVWCVMIERYCKQDGKLGWYHWPDYLPVRCKCGSMADYAEWLARNVSLIEVDGRPFWVNPSLEGAE